MKQSTANPDLNQLRNACSRCSLAQLCLPMGLSETQTRRLDTLVQPSAPLHADDHLFRIDDPFTTIYAVRSGCFKSYTVDSDGREQVLGFHLPGELMGLDAIYTRRHRCNAVALDTGTVCELPFGDLTQLASEIPELQQQIMRLLSKDISTLEDLVADHTADERLAGFLLGLSARYQHRGYSASRFRLAMPRRDIANYLRLAPETVSRILARFQGDELLKVERRDMQLLDINRLRTVAGEAHDLSVPVLSQGNTD